MNRAFMGFFFLFFSSLFLFHRFLSGLEDEKPLFMHLGGRVRRIKNDLHDVGLRYGVAHHDLVHEIHYGRGWLFRF